MIGGEDVSFDHFGEGVETLTRTVQGRTLQVRWDWGNFKTTEGYPIDENMINWVIGQEQALNEGFLCLDEWVHKPTTSRRPWNRQVSPRKSISRKTNSSLQRERNKTL